MRPGTASRTSSSSWTGRRRRGSTAWSASAPGPPPRPRPWPWPGGDGRRRTAARAWASIGLHPHEASEASTRWPRCWPRRWPSADGVVVAVGECGLDYFYEHSPRAGATAAFAAQIALAHAHDLALVIHARDAWDDLFDVLDAEGVPARTVLHCFTGGPDEVDRCLAAGMFVSFSGIITFKNAADVRAAAARCPARPIAGRDRQPVPRPGAAPGPANEPAYLPLGRRRRGRGQGLRGRGGRASAAPPRPPCVFSTGVLNHALLCVIREPSDQGFYW